MENAKRYILGVIMLLALIQGCYEDEGNYDYSPLPSIQINGMNTIYHPRRLLDSLIIPITVETEYASSDLKYTWFIFNSGKVDYISAVEVDTIGREKDLSYLVSEEPGNYILTVKVENTANQYAVYASASVRVESEFSRGFYILKETPDGNSDLDFSSDSLEMARDIFVSMKGEALKGKPLLLAQLMNTPYVDPNRQERTKGHVLGITTEESVCLLRTSDLVTVHDEESMFYGVEEEHPRRLARGFFRTMYFSENSVYSVRANTNGSGIMGVPDTIRGASKWAVYDRQKMGFMYWDELNGRFLFVNSNGVVSVYENNASSYQPNGIKDKMLYMGMLYNTANTSFKNVAYAVFESSGGERKLYKLNHGGTTNPVQEVQVFAGNTNFARATTYAVCASNTPMIYYVTDGVLYAYSFTNNIEVTVSVPGLQAGETVYYVANKYWRPYGGDYTKDYLVIGTTGGNNDYTLRLFNMVGGVPQGNSLPEYQFSGNGKVVDLQYIASTFTENMIVRGATGGNYGLCY